MGLTPATAMLDRFLAHAEILAMDGKSYRLRQRGETHRQGKALSRAES